MLGSKFTIAEYCIAGLILMLELLIDNGVIVIPEP